MRRRSPRRFSRRMHFPAPDVGLGETSGRSHSLDSSPAPSPLLCAPFSLLPGSVWDRRCVCGPESGGLFPSSDHSRPPLPCCKTPAPRRNSGPIVRRPIPPRFHLGLPEPLFCSQSKESICSGEGRGVPIASTNARVKGKIDGRKFT